METTLAALFLAAHLALCAWGVARNSVTFDENSHLASGVAAVTRGNFWISAVNPPLLKIGFGMAALAAGARPPGGSAFAGIDQFTAAEAFMRANAGRYHRVFAAARSVACALSLLLAWLVWRTARRWYGPAAGLLALGLYALSPETLAHGGLASLDLPTALAVFATVLAFLRFVRRGRWRDAALLAGVFAALVLTRFTAWLLLPLLALLACVALALRLTPHPARLLIGIAALVPAGLVALQIGYGGGTSWRPLHDWRLESKLFGRLRAVAPDLVLPLPDAYVAGLDHQAFEGQTGITPTYLFGRIITHRVGYYPLVAAAVKWPLALWGALGVAVAASVSSRLRRQPARTDRRGAARRDSRSPRTAEGAETRDAFDAAAAARSRVFGEIALGAVVVATFAAAMFAAQLNTGVRYLLPALPPLLVLAGRGVASGRTPSRAAMAIVVLLLAGAAAETARTAPWFLSFFNAAAGGPGNGDRIVNDTNVDAGQGLIALREELRRRGIQRVHLAYHGMTDPAIYGIDYLPYLGGVPGPESDWLAVSSYYFVGLSQRMMTRSGRTPFVTFELGALKRMTPAARPAWCMYLYRVRAASRSTMP